jgi:hypothetical protein
MSSDRGSSFVRIDPVTKEDQIEQGIAVAFAQIRKRPMKEFQAFFQTRVAVYKEKELKHSEFIRK